MSFTVGDDGSVEELFEGLACGEVEVLGNFQLSTDDYRNYTDKISVLTQTRYFPEEQYPLGSDPDHQTATATSATTSATSDPSQAGAVVGPSTSQAGASTASLPDLDPAVKELNETLISMHHNLVKLLEKAGVKNVCGMFERNSVDTALQSLGPKDVHCSICKKDFSNKQHLRDHIKGFHFKKTSHYCQKCKKYFTDASSLKVHTKAHDPSQLKFKCSVCSKGFLSKPKLDEHMPSHSEDKLYVCQFCKAKSYKHLKGAREHEETCSQNPKAKGPFVCRICGKKYKDRRGRKRHMKDVHDDAPAEIWTFCVLQTKCAAMEWRLGGDRFITRRCHSPYSSPFSKCPWMLPSQSHGDCAGTGDYAAMALSPHFELFILNCFIVYLPLVVYDVHDCFYFHTVSVFVHLWGNLPFLFQLYGILFLFSSKMAFQASLPVQNFIFVTT